MRARLALLALPVVLSLFAVSSASAADRYASPSGNGTACTQAQPCDVRTAIESAGTGDSVYIYGDRGDYSISGGTIVTAFSSNILGINGRPRLIFSGSGSGLVVAANSTARNLFVEASVDALGAGGSATVDNVIAHATGAASQACGVNDVTITNSVCWADGSNGFGLDSNVTGGDSTVTARNVTAFAPTGIGVLLTVNGSYTGVFNLTNVIARGAGSSGGYDINVFAGSGSTATVNVDHSNWLAAHGTGSGSHFNTGAGNQTGTPVFANAVAGDFHQLPGSPTIDHGISAAANGPADLDGDPRAFGTSTDIGADEFLPPPTVTTGAASEVTPVSATIAGTVNSNARATSYHFDYGLTAAYGASTAVTDAGAGTSDVSVSAALTGLVAERTYHYRLVATSSAGTTEGADRTFTTSSGPAPLHPGACANIFRGTAGADVLTGTAVGDTLLGLAGSDVLRGLAGDDCLGGDRGNDRLDGGRGKDRLSGGRGKDRLSGGRGNDVLVGGSGNDILAGGSGNDVISGGAGHDSYLGGSGKDNINAVDGRRETIDCGPGRDKVRSDRNDKLRHCERVTRVKRH